MGVTYTLKEDSWDGDTRRRLRVEAAFDSSYTAGGEPLGTEDVPLDSIKSVYFEEPVTENGYLASYRAEDNTITVYTGPGSAGAPLQEAADGADLSDETATLFVEGRS